MDERGVTQGLEPFIILVPRGRGLGKDRVSGGVGEPDIRKQQPGPRFWHRSLGFE